MIDDSQLSTTR